MCAIYLATCNISQTSLHDARTMMSVYDTKKLQCGTIWEYDSIIIIIISGHYVVSMMYIGAV